jgi:hypothetical protein
MGEMRNAYRILVGKLEGKRPLGRPRRRLKDNIQLVIRDLEFVDVDWVRIGSDCRML